MWTRWGRPFLTALLPLQWDRLRPRWHRWRSRDPPWRVEWQRLLQLRWRGKFLWNLRVGRQLLVEVSAAEAACVGSIPETLLTGSDLRERFQHFIGKMDFLVL